MQRVLGSPFDAGVVLHTDEDWIAIVDSVGPENRIRGMFVAPIAALLDPARRRAVLASLDEPPRGGVFVPFVLYSRRDYLRIVLAVAAAGDPAATVAERMRRIAHNDFTTFSASLLGKAVRAAVGNARAALLRTPQVYATVAPAEGGEVAGGAIDGGVEILFSRYPICWPYHLGDCPSLRRVLQHRGRARREPCSFSRPTRPSIDHDSARLR